jgi:hypothetical protein
MSKRCRLCLGAARVAVAQRDRYRRMPINIPCKSVSHFINRANAASPWRQSGCQPRRRISRATSHGMAITVSATNSTRVGGAVVHASARDTGSPRRGAAHAMAAHGRCDRPAERGFRHYRLSYTDKRPYIALHHWPLSRSAPRGPPRLNCSILHEYSICLWRSWHKSSPSLCISLMLSERSRNRRFPTRLPLSRGRRSTRIEFLCVSHDS